MKPKLATPVATPQARGPLLTDAEVAKLLKLDEPESDRARLWVRRNVPKKRPIGHNTIRWFEADVLEWVASRGDAA